METDPSAPGSSKRVVIREREPQPLQAMLRVPVHRHHKRQHYLSEAYELLENIEKNARGHHHEFQETVNNIDEDTFDIEEITYVDEYGNEVEHRVSYREKNPGCWV